jgi:hypothetical protein
MSKRGVDWEKIWGGVRGALADPKDKVFRLVLAGAATAGIGREAFLASPLNDMVVREPRDPKMICSGYLPGGRMWSAVEVEAALTVEYGPSVTISGIIYDAKTGISQLATQDFDVTNPSGKITLRTNIANVADEEQIKDPQE